LLSLDLNRSSKPKYK